MNSFLLALTAVLIIVLGALFAVPVFIDWNDYRPVFETQAAKLIGRDVKVGGNVHLVALPAPELRFDDVKVADENGKFEQPLLEAKSIEAWLNIVALLRGTIEARKITISEPVLRLALREDGSFNSSDIGRAGETLPFVPKKVMLDEISVTGGRVELSRAGQPPLIADNVAGEASAASLFGPYKVSATYDFAARPQDLRLSTSASDADGKFRLKSALRDLDRGSVYLFDGDVTGVRQKPSYEGSLVYRIASSLPAEAAQPAAQPQAAAPQNPTPTSAPEGAASGELPAAEDNLSALELKGELNATPDHAELPSFELTVHTQGRSQMMKGSLALDFGEHPKAVGALSAHWVDADALLAEAGKDAGKTEPSLAGALNAIAEKVLEQSASIGNAELSLNLEQVSVGSDLIANLDLGVTAKDGAVAIERLKADLPGETHLDVSGRLTKTEQGPVFEGPIKLDGSKLRTLARWAAGAREMSTQATVGVFALAAKATLGGGDLKLEEATGELSGTKFSGALDYCGGDQRRIDLTLDSDHLDLRELMGENAAWRSWLPDSGAQTPAANSAAEPSLIASLRDDEVHVALRVGELLLPTVPPGNLDAKFSLAKDTLDIERLDYAAVGAVTLSGKGHIDNLSVAPSGTVDGTITAKTREGLRVGAELLGLPERVTKSKELAGLAPLDVNVALTATRDRDRTRASMEIKGTSGGSQVALTTTAFGEPAKLAEAEFDIDGIIEGYRPQSVLGLLIPGLASEGLAAISGDRGKLTVAAHGVPAAKITGRVELATAALQAKFDGEGALKDGGVALDGEATVKSSNASIAFVLFGLEPSPSATNVPLDLRAELVKAGGKIELSSITGQLAGQAVEGSAAFDLGGKKTRFKVEAKAGTVSLPALLGSLVAWQRTPSTEEMLGSIAQNASQVWPARGFALQPIEDTEGEIAVAADTLSLGAPFQVEDATLKARVDEAGLTVTNLEGNLFGGSFAASGTLSPKGAGAELKAHAELAQGQLAQLTQGLAGRVLAKGPFTLGFDVSGEGLSPPGLVAGLNGQGNLFLDPGALQALSPEPLKRIAAETNRPAKLDKDQIAAKMQSLRDTLTRGVYVYGATDFPFEVKNGTLKLSPTVLAAKGAETTINGYIELASLRLDSEWAMRLSSAKNADLPPVNLVLAGAMSDAGAIVPSIDTAPVEDFFTVSRMQSDVERLETLDVSGRTQPAADTNQAAEAASDADDDSDQGPAPVAVESEKLAADKAAIEKRAADRAVAKIAEAKRLAAEKAAAEKAAAEKAAAEKLAAEKAVAEKAAEEKRLADEKAAAEKAAEAQRIAEEKAAAEKAAAEKLAAEKAAADNAAEEKRLAENAAAEKRAAEKAAAEQAAAEKRAAEKAAAVKAAEDKRLAAEKRAADRAAKRAAAKAAAEKVAEEKRLAAQAAAEKRAAEKAAAEKAAAEKAAEAKRIAEEKAAAEKAAAEATAAEKAAKKKRVAEEKAAAEAKLQAKAEATAKAAAAAPALLPTPVPQAPPQTPPVAAAEPAGTNLQANSVPADASAPATEPLPWSQGQRAPAPDVDTTAVAPDGQAEPTPAAAAEDVLPVPKPKSARKPKEAPDDWKKGVSIFGGG